MGSGSRLRSIIELRIGQLRIETFIPQVASHSIPLESRMQRNRTASLVALAG